MDACSAFLEAHLISGVMHARFKLSATFGVGVYMENKKNLSLLILLVHVKTTISKKMKTQLSLF